MDNQPRSFTDTKGRQWHLRITALSAMRMRDDLGIDLNNIASGDNNFLQELIVDTWKIVLVLDILTETRRKELGIEREDFLDSLADDVLDDAALAFINALVNFSRPLARPALKEVVNQMNSGVEIASQKLAERVRNQLPQKMQEATDSIDPPSGP